MNMSQRIPLWHHIGFCNVWIVNLGFHCPKWLSEYTSSSSSTQVVLRPVDQSCITYLLMPSKGTVRGGVTTRGRCLSSSN
jgi:hypothetical protein